MSMTRDTRIRLSAAAALAVVFGGGMAVGFVLDREGASLDLPRETPAATATEKESDPAPSGWIIDQIEMDQAQRAEVDSLLKHYGRRMTELQKSFHPRYRALVDSTNQSLRTLLSEEQLARYDELEAERLQWRSRQNSNAAKSDTTKGSP